MNLAKWHIFLKAFFKVKFGLSDLAEFKKVLNVSNQRYRCYTYGNFRFMYDSTLHFLRRCDWDFIMNCDRFLNKKNLLAIFENKFFATKIRYR